MNTAAVQLCENLVVVALLPIALKASEWSIGRDMDALAAGVLLCSIKSNGPLKIGRRKDRSSERRLFSGTCARPKQCAIMDSKNFEPNYGTGSFRITSLPSSNPADQILILKGVQST
jgi:hypothetical protein